MRKYWTGAHSKHRLQVHLVFVPKYRRRVLLGKVAVRLRSLLYEAAEANRWWISEMNVQRDHVHVLMQYRADESVAGVAQKLKWGSSLYLRREYPELEEWTWERTAERTPRDPEAIASSRTSRASDVPIRASEAAAAPRNVDVRRGAHHSPRYSASFNGEMPAGSFSAPRTSIERR